MNIPPVVFDLVPCIWCGGAYGPARVEWCKQEKRDFFAVHAYGLSEEVSAEFAADALGIDPPTFEKSDRAAWCRWWIMVEAKMKYLQADAMIAAREETK